MEENLLSEVFRIQKLMGIENKNVLNEQGVALLLKSVIRGGSKTAVEALDDAAELLVSLGKITRAEADEAIRLIKAEKELMDYIDNSYVSSKLSPTKLDDLNISEKFKTLAKKQGNKSLTKLLDEIATLTDDEIRVIANNVVRNMVKLGLFTNTVKGIQIFIKDLSEELKFFFNKGKILKLKDFENAYDTVFHHYAKDFKAKYINNLGEELSAGRMTKAEYDTYIENADKDIQEFLFNHFKKRFKMSEQPEISSEIEKFRTSSRLDETTMDSLPVTYTKNPNTWKMQGEGLSPFKDPESGLTVVNKSADNAAGGSEVTVKNTADDVVEYGDDGFDEYEYVNDPPTPTPKRDPFPNSIPDRKWYRNFFYKFCRMNFCEVLYELAVSLAKTPEQFADDMIYTQQRVIDLTRRIDETPIENIKLRRQLEQELNSEIQRLKSTTKMFTSQESGFIDQWELVKSQIRETLEDYPDWANQVIKYIENNKIAGGSVNKFIEDMKTYYDDIPTGLWDLRRVFTPEYWVEWSKTSTAKFNSKIKESYIEGSKGKAAWLGGLTKAFLTAAGSFLKTLFIKAVSFGFFGIVRSYKSIIDKLRFGPYKSAARINLFNKWNIPLDSGITFFKGKTIPGTKVPAQITLKLQSGIARWLLLYMQITIISNILEPLWNFIVNWRDSYKENIKNAEETGSKWSPVNELLNDINEQFSLQNFEFVPFFNPVGISYGVPIGESLGLTPAPLTRVIVEFIKPLVESAFSDTKEDKSKEILAQKQKEFDEQTQNIIQTINDQEKEIYEKDPEEFERLRGKEKLFNDIGDYSDPTIKKIEYSDTLRLEQALLFVPEVSPRMQNKLYENERKKIRNVKNKTGDIVGSYNPKLTDNNNFTPNQFGVSQGYVTSADIPEGTEIEKTSTDKMKSDTASTVGYWALKDKTGKLYETFQDKDKWIYFITPDVETLKTNYRVKVTENELQKFVPYLP